jgi:hypothetical protein
MRPIDRWTSILLVAVLAGHAAAGAFCETTCISREALNPRPAEAVLAGSSGCHFDASAHSNGAAPEVTGADLNHCAHAAGVEARLAERHVVKADAGAVGGHATASSSPFVRAAHQGFRTAVSLHAPPGPQIGFGLPIRI